MTKPAPVPPVGPARRPLPPMEELYLRALIHWYRHRRKPPTMAQLCDLIRRSGRGDTRYSAMVTEKWPTISTLRRGMASLIRKGYVRRNNRKFEVIR